MNIKKVIGLLLSGCAAVFILACSTQEPQIGENITQVDLENASITEIESRHIQENGKIAGDDSAIIQVSSTVIKINPKTRQITLQSGQDQPIELIAGPEVRNFNQIKVGDTVNVEYLLSVAFAVRPPTKEEIASDGKAMAMLARAKPGQLPAAGIVEGKITIARIEAIDKQTSMVTLKVLNTDVIHLVKAKYPENLAYAKVGDTVVVTTMEALATEISRAEK